MPYPNFHSARVSDPGTFEESSFRYVKLKGTSVETVMAKKKGEKSMEIQAYRFPVEKFTAAEAKEWLKEHDIKAKFEEAKKKDHADSNEEFGMNKVNRFDAVDSMQWMASPFVRTAEGFLKGRAIVTSVGVFEYANADGSSQFELRLPEEVFAYDSIESLKLKPLANDHPKEIVTPENIKKYQVGSLGDNPGSITGSFNGCGCFVNTDDRTDGMHLAIDMIINDAGTIQDVLNGKQELSCGYTCDLEESEGRWCGVHYDFIQRRIRYNHVAIVDEARAGDAARIRLDSKDAVLVKNIKEDNMAAVMKKITLDGIEYEAEAKILETLVTEKKRADELTGHLDTKKTAMEKLQGEHDALKDKHAKLQDAHDKLKDKLEKMQDDDDDDEEEDDKKDKKSKDSSAEINPIKERIKKAVDKRLVVLDAALKAGIEKIDGVSNSKLMKEVILKVSPSANLDGKDKAYITARFDASVEMLASETANNDSIRHLNSPVVPETRADGSPAPKGQKGARTSEQARQDMIDRLKTKKDKGVK
jgi:hypothetical protein